MGNTISRENPFLSACGLNCGLCPNFHLHTNGSFKCPGCGCEGFADAHPACGVLSCCYRKGISYCWLCDEFPCKKYDGADLHDSFITHKNQFADMEKAKRIGVDAYTSEQSEKVGILKRLLQNYNDGRRKSFFCAAVNLLELQDIENVMPRLDGESEPEAPLKTKAAFAAHLFEETARQRGISLKLRKGL